MIFLMYTCILYTRETAAFGEGKIRITKVWGIAGASCGAAESAAFGGDNKLYIFWGASGAPNGLNTFSGS